MPANLTPEYKKADEWFRSATTDPERLTALEEMLRVIPKHKGTEHIQADIKRKISKIKESANAPHRGAAAPRSPPDGARPAPEGPPGHVQRNDPPPGAPPPERPREVVKARHGAGGRRVAAERDRQGEVARGIAHHQAALDERLEAPGDVLRRKGTARDRGEGLGEPPRHEEDVEARLRARHQTSTTTFSASPPASASANASAARSSGSRCVTRRSTGRAPEATSSRARRVSSGPEE